MVSAVQAAPALRPQLVAAYLHAHGWSKMREIGDVGAVWKLNRDSGSPLIIHLPLQSGLADNSIRMFEALVALEEAEARPLPQILTDIESVDSDVVRLRLMGPDVENGTVPLAVAGELFTQARELMVASAYTVERIGRRVVPSQRPQSVYDYLKRLRLGQTERGSFVMTVHSPVAPALNSQMVLPDIEEFVPFERQVTTRLTRVLYAAKRAVDLAMDERSFDEFERGEAALVSANHLEAISQLLRGSGARSLSIAVQWAPIRPQITEAPSEVVFTADTVDVLTEAAHIIRAKEPVHGFEVQGYVIGLERQKESPTGTITVSAAVDGRARKVRLTLEDADYQHAIEAHKHNRLITCTGELVRQGSAYVLEQPHDFAVIPDDFD